MNFKCHVKKNDKVKVISGKDSGKVGKILDVDMKKNRVLVENINLVKKHVKPTNQNRQGGIINSESFIHSSNVMLVCEKCVTPARVRFKLLKNGKKNRICKKCNETVDI